VFARLMKSMAMNRSTNALQINRYMEEPPKLNGNVDLFMRKGYFSHDPSGTITKLIKG
jgi:hypothetical protein